MGRITRYVVYELLVVFLISLVAMTSLMILVGVANEALRQGLGIQAIIELVPYVLPNALCFAIPGTMLFSACCIYGRMSSCNEIVAIKSLGVSPLVVLWPAFIVAFILSLVSVWLNDLSVSWGRRGVYHVVLNSVEKTVYGTLRQTNQYVTDQFSIFVQDVDGKMLIGPRAQIKKDGQTWDLTAQKAELKKDTENGELIIRVFNARVELDGSFNASLPQEDFRVPLSSLTRKASNTSSPSSIAIRAIPDELEKQRAEVKSMRQKLAIKACFQMATGDLAQLNEPQWSANLAVINDGENREKRLITEPWRRWANGFSCLLFVFAGAPLAIKLQNADVWSSFGTCFIPILIVYYPLLAFGLDRAKTGSLPPYTVWLANVVMLVIGFVLIRKMTRH